MSKKFNKVKEFYDKGFWNEKMVMDAVDKGWITKSEFTEIVGDMTSA